MIIRLLCVLLLLCFYTKNWAQSSSSELKTLKRRIAIVESKLDSLISIQSATDTSVLKRSDLFQMLNSINGETGQIFADENRRSKRRGLDELFEETLKNQKGLNLSGQMMGVLFWDLKGENVNTAVGTLDIFAASSFGANNLVFINLQSVGGNGPIDNISNVHGYHAGAGSTRTNGINTINVLEAWTEFEVSNFTAIIGKIDLTNYFDPNSVANDEYTQFVSGGFVNSAAFAVPSNAPGFVLSSDFLHTLTFKIGVSSIDNEVNDLFEDLFLVGQLSRDFFNRKEEQVGSLSVYVFNNTSFLNGWGGGISGDLKLFSNVYSFGRFGYNYVSLMESTNVKSSWSVGLQSRDFFKLKNYSISTAVAYANHEVFASKYSEHAFEAYMKYGFSNKIFCSPLIKYFINSSGNNRDNQLLIGIRSRVTF